MVTGWRAWAARILVVALTGVYLLGSYREVSLYNGWYDQRAHRIRDLVLAARASVREHPGAAIVLQGVDDDLFHSGVEDGPLRLIGVPNVYIAPGEEGAIHARADLGGIGRFQTSTGQLLRLLDRGEARVLRVTAQGTRDVTAAYRGSLLANPNTSRRAFVDVGDPDDAGLLGPEWYRAEGGFRWMPKTATVKLSVPPSPQRLYVSGFAPAAVLASGPVKLQFSVAGHEIGSGVVDKADRQFRLEIPLPGDFPSRDVVELTIATDKVLHSPSDIRELGMVFGTFAIR